MSIQSSIQHFLGYVIHHCFYFIFHENSKTPNDQKMTSNNDTAILRECLSQTIIMYNMYVNKLYYYMTYLIKWKLMQVKCELCVAGVAL